MDLTADLDLAVAAAIAAGQHLAAAFGSRGRVWYKGPDQPVTEADIEADRILRESLGAARPEYTWLSEEMEGHAAVGPEPTWVVDPLDGTANFVSGRAEFAVCVGLLIGGTPALGVVYDPIERVTYGAIAGGGATRNGTPIRARRYPGERPVLVAASGEHRSGGLDAFSADWETTLLGSTALKMVRVAEGGADAYVSGTYKGIWDVCAGSLIVEEAGGLVRDLDGLPLGFLGPVRKAHGLIVVGRDAENEIATIVELARQGGLAPEREETR